VWSLATGQLRSNWGQPTARVCLRCSKVPTRICTLNNHCVHPSAVSTRRLSVVVCHGIHEVTKPGGHLHPVSTHEAAFWAPSPPSSIQTTNMTAHPSSPMVDPHSKPNANQSTDFRVTPTAARECQRAPTSTLKCWLETSTRPPTCQPCHTPLQAVSATSLHRPCL